MSAGTPEQRELRDAVVRGNDEVGEHFLQPKITGYRQLSAKEAGMMNAAKAVGDHFEALVTEVRKHIEDQRRVSPDESRRLDDAEPERWAAMARTDMQNAVMKLCRAVAQPKS